ncbi:MAG TPA: guanylate kinase [Acidimicrobiales bacterium]|nr:guanylate kinase [Acidimicrobiales bacterium]
MSAEPLLVVLIGPGGVGKGTLARRLVDADPALWLSRSWTTRERRPSEHGDEYFYVDRSTFEKAIESQQFLEWAEFHGHLYGTPLPDAPKGADVLLEIEVQGAEQVLKIHPDAVVLLILPPSLELLEERLRARGDDDEHVAARLESAPAELERGHQLASYVIVNDDLERASREIVSILEELRRQRRESPSKD